MVGKARRNLPTMDLVVFPEYALHGLSMDTNPEIMCSLDGPEVAAFQQACSDNRIWGCFSIMELNPERQSLQFRHHHRRSPASSGSTTASCIPGCRSSRGSRAISASRSSTARRAAKLALIICHDGMFPEMARECAYKGAEIMLRTAGYTAPIRDSWRFTNQSNAFCNLMVTANVCMCGSRRHLQFHGRGHDRQFRRHRSSRTARAGAPDEIITAEVRPDLVREARASWGVENNIYQLGHRGFTAVAGGAGDCPYTYMHDLVAGRYRLPGRTRCRSRTARPAASPRPTRRYGEPLAEAAE